MMNDVVGDFFCRPPPLVLLFVINQELPPHPHGGRPEASTTKLPCGESTISLHNGEYNEKLEGGTLDHTIAESGEKIMHCAFLSVRTPRRSSKRRARFSAATQLSGTVGHECVVGKLRTTPLEGAGWVPTLQWQQSLLTS